MGFKNWLSTLFPAPVREAHYVDRLKSILEPAIENDEHVATTWNGVEEYLDVGEYSLIWSLLEEAVCSCEVDKLIDESAIEQANSILLAAEDDFPYLKSERSSRRLNRRSSLVKDPSEFITETQHLDEAAKVLRDNGYLPLVAIRALRAKFKSDLVTAKQAWDGSASEH